MRLLLNRRWVDEIQVGLPVPTLLESSRHVMHGAKGGRISNELRSLDPAASHDDEACDGKHEGRGGLGRPAEGHVPVADLRIPEGER